MFMRRGSLCKQKNSATCKAKKFVEVETDERWNIFGTVLRAAGDTKTPMKVGVIVNLTNVVLNFLMIYPTRTVRVFGASFTMPGAGWGVIGAAIASAIAFTVGGI